MSIKKIFSSKPAQITHAAMKLTNQIFGEDKDIEVASNSIINAIRKKI